MESPLLISFDPIEIVGRVLSKLKNSTDVSELKFPATSEYFPGITLIIHSPSVEGENLAV